MNHGKRSLTGKENAQGLRGLFEDCAWVYAICREYLFRDHTEAIARSLFPAGIDSDHACLVEAGCGPGFYSRRLAQRYPSLRVLGIDRSSRLVSWARSRAFSSGLKNCSFIQGDVECLSDAVHSVDAVISSRLFLVVDDRAGVLGEMFRVLKPGGRLFLAEPTAGFKTQIPLSAMRLIQRVTTSSAQRRCCKHAQILGRRDFEEFVRSQPWGRVSIYMRGDYQCAVCEKSGLDTPLTTETQAKGCRPPSRHLGHELHAV